MSKILIAEDDSSLRLFIKINLTKRGYEVYETQDGQQALDVIQDAPLDLILLDLYLPFLNGLQVLEYLEKQPTPTPVVVFSARPEEHLATLRGYAFVKQVLTKPFTVAQLTETVQQALAL